VPRDLQRHAIPLEQGGIDIDRDTAEIRNGSILRSTGDNSTVALFDWLRRDARQADPSVVWNVYRDGADIVAEDGRGGLLRAPLSGARSVRIVPLTGGNHHANSRGGGWQVALGHSGGDALLGKPLADWRSARELARQICARTELPLDELTEKMFSRVGQYSPAQKDG
jgi:hypothetical protein